MVNSRQKGKRGELEWAAWLRDRGVEARRGQQYRGGGDAPDIISDDTIFWEVKRGYGSFNIYRATDQAVRDNDGRIPAVAHRRDRGQWWITSPAMYWRWTGHMWTVGELIREAHSIYQM